jgi:hypothetical protein
MDPLMQQVKELLESADPQVRVVECLPTIPRTAATAATNDTDPCSPSRDANNPDEAPGAASE